jgi:branched-subunit amino acid aminotransferase/4-amino-4-deoxychorismate lyase
VPFPGLLKVPEGGADRVQRLAVNRRGVDVTEREAGSTAPVRLVTSPVPHPQYHHKTTERASFDRALEEAHRSGADDALMLSPRGEVAEATIWCLYWWEPEGLCAPALEIGILPGVSRARIDRLAGPIHPRRVLLPALAGRSLLLSNAARGVVEVSSLDGVAVPRDARTATLQARFWP